MHSAIVHHLLTDAQPVPEQWLPPVPDQAPAVLLSRVPWSMGHPSGHLGQLSCFCPLPAPRAPPASTVPATAKKMNTIPAKTRADLYVVTNSICSVLCVSVF